MKNNIVARNDSESVTLPKKKKKEIKILTLDEQEKIVQFAKIQKIGIVIILALFTGLRIGELLGLKWVDINFENKILKVKRIIQRIKTFEEKGPKTIVVESTPKSESGIRAIPLLDNIIILLERHRELQKDHKIKVEPLYQDLDYIFCKEDGRPYDSENFLKFYYRFIEDSGLGRKFNFHSIRHTFVSRGLENGIELKVMQEILGHSTMMLTADTYTHILPEKKRNDINKLNELSKNSTD